jgi:hypothetical protein
LGNNPEDAEDVTNLITSSSHISYRAYFSRIEIDRPELLSDWVYLEEGKPYYIEGRHYEGWGGDHLSVAVEIERDSDAEEHPSQMAEIQFIGFSANGHFEQSQLVVEGVDEGYYKMVFMHPTDLEYDPYVSEAIPADATAELFKESIQGWYSDIFGSTITVTLEKYDSNGDLIEENEEEEEGEEAEEAVGYGDWVKSVYNITLDRYIEGKSTSNVMVVMVGSSATVNYVMPDDVQLSGAPLGGKFQVDCMNADGYTSSSWEFAYDISAWHLRHWLMMSCHGLRDKIDVWEDSIYPYYENGRAFRLRYYGKNEDVGQAQIRSADDEPLTGDSIEYFANTSHPFNHNLFYEPIPYDMLRVYVEEP